MSDRVSPTRSVTHRRGRQRRSEADRVTVEQVRSAVAVPWIIVVLFLGVAVVASQMSAVTTGQLLGGLVCCSAVAGAAGAHRARSAADAVQAAMTRAHAAQLGRIADAAGAVEKTVLWTADEVCRGGQPPVPDSAPARNGDQAAQIEGALSELQVQAVASLIRVRDESQSMILLEVLRRLAEREHALVSRALVALSRLETLTDDPELLAKIWEIDHLVTRVRRQVESTAVLGGESLRTVRRPVSVTTVLRGALSEVVQYSRVAVVTGSVGAARLALPGHVGPDLTHLLAELIENSCDYSDPSTKVHVRAQQVPAGLAIEVEDRALPMGPRLRGQLNQLLRAPDEVDVSGQVRAGQIGLLTAAKIAQRHGMSIRLSENTTGGTTALVVIPGQSLVRIQTEGHSGAPHTAPPASSPTAPPTPRSKASAAPFTPDQPSSAVSLAPHPGTGAAGRPSSAPPLPQRNRSEPAARPQGERPSTPSTTATPGLAAAFRNAMGTGQAMPSSPAPERPSDPGQSPAPHT